MSSTQVVESDIGNRDSAVSTHQVEVGMSKSSPTEEILLPPPQLSEQNLKSEVCSISQKVGKVRITYDLGISGDGSAYKLKKEKQPCMTPKSYLRKLELEVILDMLMKFLKTM